MNSQLQPAPQIIERIPLDDLGDYLRRHSLELAEVTLDCRRHTMYACAQTRPRGQGGAVKVIQVG